MTCSSKSQIDIKLQDTISTFLTQYGSSGLNQALQLYKNTQQEYICRTRTSISKINISDIYYMEIQEHQITIYTQHGTYHKYGTLNNELKSLSPYGFIKCSQSCIVSLGKIKAIHNALTIITAFSGSKK